MHLKVSSVKWRPFCPGECFVIQNEFFFNIASCKFFFFFFWGGGCISHFHGQGILNSLYNVDSFSCESLWFQDTSVLSFHSIGKHAFIHCISKIKLAVLDNLLYSSCSFKIPSVIKSMGYLISLLDLCFKAKGLSLKWNLLWHHIIWSSSSGIYFYIAPEDPRYIFFKQGDLFIYQICGIGNPQSKLHQNFHQALVWHW